ncbi:MAG: hypothetical protein ACRYGR_00635 [Janthinobacterium lividum]
MAPTALSIKLKNALVNDFGQDYWTSSTCKYDRGYEESSIFQYADRDQGLSIVTNPIHDLSNQSSPMEKVKSGNLSFQHAWQAVKDYQFDSNSSNVRILMPLGESNKMAGLKRNHWTTLMFTKDGSAWDATLYDSKGFLDSLYSRQVIADALSKEGIKLNYQFLGHQGLRSNSDCGYFSIAYILKALQGKNIADLTNQELSKKFIEFNK